MMLCYEMANSRRFTVDAKTPAGTIGYVVTGANPGEEPAVQYAVLLESPGTFGGLRRQTVDVEHQGGTLWHATVRYALVERSEGADGGGEQTGEAPPPETPTPPGDMEPLTADWAGEIGGETVHITQSKRTRSKTARPGATAPDFKGAIGVSKDGVAGCDVLGSKFEFSLTRQFRYVTRKYLRVLSYMAGKVCAGNFMGWSDEEVLFSGASFQGGSNQTASITYKFKAGTTQYNVFLGAETAVVRKQCSTVSGNPTLLITEGTAGIVVGMLVAGNGATIPAGTTVLTVDDATHVTLSANATADGVSYLDFSDGSLVVPEVRPWDHVWCTYGLTTSQDSLVQQPTAAYVEVVYDSADFSALGLGV